jgi:hypothetical protein
MYIILAYWIPSMDHFHVSYGELPNCLKNVFASHNIMHFYSILHSFVTEVLNGTALTMENFQFLG